MIKLLQGDALALLKSLKPEVINTCITSPPYWGLRNYGMEGQLGLEKSPQEYVARLVELFREVRRVLKSDGTLWLNLGDSYAGSGRGGNPEAGTKQGTNKGSQTIGVLYGREYDSAEAEHQRIREQFDVLKSSGIKQKDLVGIPWRVAFALQQDGWYLRQDIIWAKPNPMPESVRDRCTKSHEYLFLLSKQPKYYFDADAIDEPVSGTANAKISKAKIAEISTARMNGANTAVGFAQDRPKKHKIDGMVKQNESYENAVCLPVERRNKRSVWTITTKPFKEAHFATFPPDLVEPCALAGCPEQGVILDPFAGSGTVGMVANKLNRHAILFELNPDYIEIAKRRCGLATQNIPPQPNSPPPSKVVE